MVCAQQQSSEYLRAFRAPAHASLPSLAQILHLDQDAAAAGHVQEDEHTVGIDVMWKNASYPTTSFTESVVKSSKPRLPRSGVLVLEAFVTKEGVSGSMMLEREGWLITRKRFPSCLVNASDDDIVPQQMDGGTSQQSRHSGPLIALEDDLYQAIEQGHKSTHLLQTTIARLRHQLHQQNTVSGTVCSTAEEKLRVNCCKMDDKDHRWKGECRTLEEAAQEKSMKLDEMEWDRQDLRAENTDLRRRLQQREKELSDWKEDCMFFAVKFMNWGPSLLLNWGPALHHEFQQKLLQRQRKEKSDVTVMDDVKLKSRVVVGSLRSTFMEQSQAAGVDHQHRNLSKDSNHDQSRGHLCINRRWTSKKRKCLSCSSDVSAAV